MADFVSSCFCGLLVGGRRFGLFGRAVGVVDEMRLFGEGQWGWREGIRWAFAIRINFFNHTPKRGGKKDRCSNFSKSIKSNVSRTEKHGQVSCPSLSEVVRWDGISSEMRSCDEVCCFHFSCNVFSWNNHDRKSRNKHLHKHFLQENIQPSIGTHDWDTTRQDGIYSGIRRRVNMPFANIFIS